MILVYDIKLRRPACALLQVIKGGDLGIANRFPVESWLINPTPDMKLYLVSEDQLKLLIKVAEREFNDRTT